MIALLGQITLPPEDMDGFEHEVAAMRPKVLAEQGCHHYSLLIEDRAAGVINVAEIWDDDAALAVHLKQPWIAAFFARFGGRMLSSTVMVHDLAGSPRPLPL